MSGRLYTYDEIRVLHLEPSARCQAACPMCGRNLSGGRTRKNLPLDEITLAQFKDWFSDAFLRKLSTMFLCGNFGDPIMARDCLPILEHARAVAPRISLSVNTNGSARTPDFWRGLAELGVTVHFAIDGARAESHVRYRRHTRFDTILENAATFIAAGGRAVWEMLVFAHNEDEVDEARARAETAGFAKFVMKSTSRFHGDICEVEDETGRVVDTIRPSWRFTAAPGAHAADPADLARCEIDCKVRAEGSVYVSASGLVFPCCWLGAPVIDRPGMPDSRHRFRGVAAEMASYIELLDLVGQDRLDLHHTPLPVIVNRQFPHFARRWAPGEARLVKCARICGQGKADPVTSQLVRAEELS